MKLLFILIALLPLSVWGASSREERQNKNYEMTLSAGGDYLDSTYGITFSKFIKSDELISLKAGYNDEGDDEQTHAAIQYKRFIGNSFYLAPEAYYFHFFDKKKDGENVFDITVDKLAAVGVSLRIGNQWSWERFTLGVDWIGAGKNLATWTKDDEDIDAGFTYTILNFYVGWSF